MCCNRAEREAAAGLDQFGGRFLLALSFPVITVIGKDMVGILARVSAQCAGHGINVLEVTQSILQDMFAMIMMVDISKSDIPFTQFADELTAIGKEMGLSVHAMHEDIFNAMHTI